MCGRFSLTATPDEVRALLDYIEQPNFPPRYNIAPTQPVAVVTAGSGDRHFKLVRWGLIPSWVKDPESFTLLINARIETAATKPSFRAAMRRRRCLVPASGFYEWQRGGGKGKTPYWLAPGDGKPFAFAGIWEEWSDPRGGEVATGAILTAEATADIASIHTRMPVVVEPEHYDAWLDTENVKPQEAVARLVQNPGFFRATAVSTLVNAVRNDGPELQRPAEPAAEPEEAPAEEGGKDDPDQLTLL